jgi:aldehyde dehydrogenase (NAD+)
MMDPRAAEPCTSFVTGRRVPASGRAVELTDPATGRLWNRGFIDSGIVETAVASAAATYRGAAWQSLSNQDRALRLRRLAELIVSHAEELGRLETLANGKPLAHTTGEMRAAAKWYQFFANAAELAEGKIREIGRNAEAHIVREPLGVVLAITPFNGALSLGSWKMAPALAAGNTVILKPPPDAPASSLRLAELALEAGFPAGAVNVVIGDAAVGQALAAHDDVAMVSFTGSTAAARGLAAAVGSSLKRFVCEAGGKSAHIVFADADLDDAVVAARQGVFSASGQTCVAGARILVEESVRDAFLERYVAAVRRLRVGDPREAGTHIGPVASRRQLDRVKGFVDRAVADGARVLVGGVSPAMPAPLDGGFWFMPTVLDDVRPEMEICREEVFGPVATIQSFRTEEEALSLANGVAYGLAAGFWTRDMARVRRLSCGLQAGTVWVNCYRLIHWLAPFGGYKQSGLGRENGIEAMDEFTQIKSIVTDHARPVDPFAA